MGKINNTTPRDRTAMRLCNLSSLWTLDGALHRMTAFGVFGRLQVTNFDGFLFLVSHFSFPLLGCLLFVLCQ